MTDYKAVGRKSKRKGRTGEAELAKLLTAAGYPSRRGCQHNGKEIADVVGLPNIHIECKRVERLSIYSAIEQSINDSKPLELPTVFHRQNNKGWLVTMPLNDWLLMYGLTGLGENERNIKDTD